MHRLDMRSKISLILAILSWIEGTVDSVRCLKDDTVPDWYPVNVYYCNDTFKPICCNDDKQFKCCEQSGTVQLRDQIVTWAVIFGFILCVVTVWCCYRKETHICETDNIVGKCCIRCCPCCDCCCAPRELENSKTAFDGLADDSEPNARSSSADQVARWDEHLNAYYGKRIDKWNGKVVVEKSSTGADNEAFHYSSFPTKNATASAGVGREVDGKDMLRGQYDADLIEA